MVLSNSSEPMFKFTTKLFVWKNRVKKSGYSSLYLQIYIYSSGTAEREYIPLDLEWPIKYIDLEQSILLKRFNGDTDVNDYNMIIMSERSKLNEIAKLYRLTNRNLSIELLKRELIFADSNKSVVSYIRMKRDELYQRKMIVHQTWKHYGTTAKRIEQYHSDVRFDQVNKKWLDNWKVWLKTQGNAYNTIWTRIKELKALLTHASEEATIHIDHSILNYSNKYIEQPIVYLNKSEVKTLLNMHYNNPEYKINFPNNRKLTEIEKAVLKAFLFSCFTSLRISDLYSAQSNWMISDNFMAFTMQKNKERKPKKITIPIASLARGFINESLTGKIFRLPTQQEYNRTLKDIAKLANINKRLTSHVGRHTFGYLFMTNNGDIFALKEIMGHSKIETTQRYAHLDEDSKLELVMNLQRDFI